MKYLSRSLKGTYGYLKAQRNFEIIKTVVLFAMALGIFLIGYITLGTKKNLWTVFAILGMLPACKSLVGVIMLLRFKSLSKDVYAKYSNAVGDLPTLYENVITTNEKSYFVPVICCEGNTLIAFCSLKSASDTKKITDHINLVMKNAGHKVTVKIFDDESAFLRRAAEMNKNIAGGNLLSTEAVFNTIKAVSL